MTPTDRMRKHRVEMDRALRDGVSLEEARKRIAIEQRAEIGRCGRVIGGEASASGPAPVASPRPVAHHWWMDL